MKEIWQVIEFLCDGDLAATEPLAQSLRSDVTIEDIYELYQVMAERL